MKKLTAAKYLHFIKVDKGTYIGWNRYWPSIFILNEAALKLLDRVRDGRPIERNEEIDYFLDQFKKYRFIFEGDNDPSKENFVRMVRDMDEQRQREAGDFYRQKQAYDGLKIVNDECNLTCSYCVNHDKKKEYQSPNIRAKLSRAEKLEIVNKIVDQYLGAALPAKEGGKTGGKEAGIFFSGGEILLEWELLKEVVRRIDHKYASSGTKIDYEINTNLTLLTEEMAEFFKKHDFKVHISIDGYREAHNRTRKYVNGAGSFDDIIRKLEIFRRVYGENSLTTFQGTIEYPEDFSPEEVYRMEEYGFIAARLAPNLLHVSEKDGRKKALIMENFLELNSHRKFQVTELIFTRLKDKVNREEYRFSFNCQGLDSLPGLGIEINLSTMNLSQVCGFVPQAGVPIDELGFDIYNPKLWQVSSRFLKARMETLLSDCLACELVGICVGGCVMSGLDTANRVNKAACAYQEEMWKIYIKKAYNDSK